MFGSPVRSTTLFCVLIGANFGTVSAQKQFEALNWRNRFAAPDFHPPVFAFWRRTQDKPATPVSGLFGISSDLYQSNYERLFTDELQSGIAAFVDGETAKSAYWAAILLADDPDLPWERVAQRFRWVAQEFPDSSYGRLADESASTIERMLDAKSRHESAGAAEALTVEARVDELIFQLMNQDGEQHSDPGAVDFFWNDRVSRGDREPSPAQQLVNIGMPAVPQLITALDDDRYTRSVSRWRSFFFSHRILTVRECVVAILHRITGEPFYKSGTTDERVELIKAWWTQHSDSPEA